MHLAPLPPTVGTPICKGRAGDARSISAGSSLEQRLIIKPSSNLVPRNFPCYLLGGLLGGPPGGILGVI